MRPPPREEGRTIKWIKRKKIIYTQKRMPIQRDCTNSGGTHKTNTRSAIATYWKETWNEIVSIWSVDWKWRKRSLAFKNEDEVEMLIFRSAPQLTANYIRVGPYSFPPRPTRGLRVATLPLSRRKCANVGVHYISLCLHSCVWSPRLFHVAAKLSPARVSSASAIM